MSALFDGRASGGKSILIPSALTLPRLDLPDLDFTGALVDATPGVAWLGYTRRVAGCDDATKTLT